MSQLQNIKITAVSSFAADLDQKMKVPKKKCFLSDDQLNNTIANENNKYMKKETEKMKECVISINSGIIWKLKKLKP